MTVFPYDNEPAEVRRIEFDSVDARLSALSAGRSGPVGLFLHGTYWSRVWQPVLGRLGNVCRCIALDLPGFGRSEGELKLEQATLPALARIVLNAADALDIESFAVIGHDVGGGIAQHLAVHSPDRVFKMALVNAVMFDSWPVPGVARYRDPQVREATTTDDILAARRQSLARAIARPMGEDEIADYLSPWKEPRQARSWMAMAAAADPRFTIELEDGLIRRRLPTLLVWGRDDEFQLLSFAQRYIRVVPAASLRIVEGKHIVQEDAPGEVGAALADFLAGPVR